MKNILTPWLFWKHFVFCFLLFFVIWPLCKRILLLSVFIGLLGRRIIDLKEASSIGIIGGADGPTAIFISSRVGLPHLPSIIFIISLLLYKPVKSLIERLF